MTKIIVATGKVAGEDITINVPDKCPGCKKKRSLKMNHYEGRFLCPDCARIWVEEN